MDPFILALLNGSFHLSFTKRTLSEVKTSDRCGVVAITKYTYASSLKLHVGAMSNIVEATKEAASPSRERQSMCRLCEKVFGHTCWRQGATLHKAPAAKRKTREAVSYFHRTLLSDLEDW